MSNIANKSFQVTEYEWQNSKCDKTDILVSVFCGTIAGMIDVVFVNSSERSLLGKNMDLAADELVKKFATLNGWTPKLGKENNVSSAIGFLEGKFKVNYDQRNGADVDWKFKLSTKNHHFKSLAHSPDLLGLFFSILDQFMNTASFFSGGKIIRVDTTTQELRIQGKTFEAKLYAGFCNWIGHIMSDMSGSSGGRGIISGGRGMGVPIPLTNLFQLCEFENSI